MSTQTEKPTQSHRKRLRQQGHVPRSLFLPSAVGLLVAVTLAPLYFTSLLRVAEQQLLGILQQGSPFSTDQLAVLAQSQLHNTWRSLAYGLGVVTTVVLIVAVAQTGGLVFSVRSFGTEQRQARFPGLKFKPLAVLVSHTAQLLLPIVLVWLVAAWLVVRDAPASIAARGQLPQFIALIAKEVRQLLLSAACALLLLAVLDWLVQWYAFRWQSLQTPEARKRDEREQRGAPETLEARRQRRSELAQLTPLGLLPYCQLIIDDGGEHALLIAYRLEVDRTPQVIAIVGGSDRIALLQAAATAKIPLVVLPWLAERLRRLPVNATPPMEIQVALAEVLAEQVFADNLGNLAPSGMAVEA